MAISDDSSRKDPRGGHEADPVAGTPAVSHDPSRLVGRVVDATVDGARTTWRIVAVGAGGVQLLDRHSDRSVLVPPADVPTLHLSLSPDADEVG